MANSRLLQAIITRLGGGDSTKLRGLSEVIPKPATKSVGETKTLRGPGPSQELFERGELGPPRLLEDIPPGEPRIGSPTPQRATTSMELRGRPKAMALKEEREAIGEFPDFEINELFDQFEPLERSLQKGLPGVTDEGELRKLFEATRTQGEFRKRASRAAGSARESGRRGADTEIGKLRDEFTAPLDPDIVAKQKGKQELRLLNILEQREQRNLIRNKR